MAVGKLMLELEIAHAQSLKDRRQVVRSLKDKLRQGFNVSVAEMDDAALWNQATLAVVAVSPSTDYLMGQLRELLANMQISEFCCDHDLVDAGDRGELLRRSLEQRGRLLCVADTHVDRDLGQARDLHPARVAELGRQLADDLVLVGLAQPRGRRCLL